MRRRQRTLWFVVLWVGLSALPVFAQSKELVVWGGFSQDHAYAVAMNKLAAAFGEIHPEIKVTYETVAGMAEKLPIAIATGTGPDMAIVAGGILPNRSELPKVLIPLTPYYERDEVSDAFVPGSLTWFSWDGVSYAAPLSLDFNFPLVINNDTFQSAGLEYQSIDSIDAIWDVSSKLTRIGSDGEVEAAAMRPWNLYGLHQGLITWVHAFGGHISDGKVYTFDHPAVAEALRWLVDYADTFGRTLIPDDPSRVAMTPAVLARVQTYAESTHVDTDLRLIPFPAKTRGEASVWLGGQWLGITASSNNRDESWEFVKWATATLEGAEVSNGLLISGAIEPHQAGIYITPPVTYFDRLRNEYMSLVSHVRPLEHPAVYFWDDLIGIVQRVVLDHSIPVETAVESYHEVLNAKIRPLIAD